MRHRDKETAAMALESWKALRSKVEQEGGDHYEKPVLVQFLDTNTFEVMDRDIVEDEFYVLRRYKIVRELDPKGTDLEDAIRSHRKPQSSARGGKPKGRRPEQQGKPQQAGKSQGRRRRRRPPRRKKERE